MPILRKLGIHHIPRLSMGGKDVVLRMKPTGIIQTRGGYTDLRRRNFGFRSGNARTTIAAKAALVRHAFYPLRKMISQ